VLKCPFKLDKYFVELQALPENEKTDVVFQVQNLTNKEYMLEVTPPPLSLSGLMVTPLVLEMKGKSAGLISVTYHS